MTVAEITSVESALGAVRMKDEEILQAEGALRVLCGRREREAVAGGDTHPLRAEIADAQAELEELRMQATHLAMVLEGARDLALHRERHAALAGIYRRDLEYLAALRRVRKTRAEAAAANTALEGICQGQPYWALRRADPDLARLGVEADPKAPAPVLPLGRGDTVEEIDADIARVERLAAEAEEESQREVHALSNDTIEE